MMRRNIFIVSKLLLILLIFPLFCWLDKDLLADKNSELVTIGVYTDNKPLIYSDENGEVFGIIPDILSDLFQEIGFRLSFVDLRINTDPNFNPDLLITINHLTPSNLMEDSSVKIASLPSVILNRESSPFVFSLQDLDNKIIAVEKGAPADHVLRSKNVDAEISYFTNYIDVFDSLRLGVVDAAICDFITAAIYIKKSFDNNFKIASAGPVGFSDINLINNSMNNERWSYFKYQLSFVDNNYVNNELTKYISSANLIYIGKNIPKRVITISTIVSALIFFTVTFIFFKNKKLTNIIKRDSLLIEKGDKKYKKIIDNAQAGFLFIHDNDTFDDIDCNKRGAEILGYGSISDFKRSFYVDRHFVRQELVSFIDEVKSKKDIKNQAIKGSSHLGETIWLRCHGKAFPEENSIVMIFIDDTDRVVAEQNLRKYQGDLEALVRQRTQELEQAVMSSVLAQESAEKANKAKSVFLSNITHELRTPLTAILGYAHLLSRKNDIKEEYLNKIEIIERSGKHLSNMINEVLDLSKIEAGKEDLNLKSFSIRDLFSDLENMFKEIICENNNTLKLSIPTKIPDKIFADEGKIRQVLINLIGNACKFTKYGIINIKIAMGPSIEKMGGGILNISISDTGDGINEDEIETLFTPFEQAKLGRRSKNSTGLGLAISMRYAKLMSGDISVKSSVGVGSTFKFSFKYHQVDKSLPEYYDINRINNSVKGKTILVVDDLDEMRDLLSSIFDTYPVQVKTVSSGQEALSAVSEEQIDLVLLDMNMPQMSGQETLMTLKSGPYSDIPVIVVSADPLSKNIQDIIEAGASAFLAKPLCEDSLLSEIVDLFESDNCQISVVNYCDAYEGEGAISRIPESFRSSLIEAVSTLNPEIIDAAVSELVEMDPDAGKFVRSFSRTFNYDALLKALRKG